MKTSLIPFDPFFKASSKCIKRSPVNWGQKTFHCCCDPFKTEKIIF